MSDRIPLVQNSGQLQQLQAADGIAVKDVTINDLGHNMVGLGTDTKLDTGVPFDERKKFKIAVSYSAPNILVSILFNTPYTSFSYYIQGKKYTVTDLTPFTNISVASAEGVWFFYIDHNNAVVLTQTPWTIYNPDVLLWNFYFDNTAHTVTWIGEERHTAGRDIFNHARNHAQGALYKTGFAFSQYNGLANLSGNTDNNFGRAMAQFSSGSFFDEDILNTINHLDAAISSTTGAPNTDWNLTVNQFLGFTALAQPGTGATTIVFNTSRTLVAGQGFVCMQGNTQTVRGTGTITTGGTGTTFTASSVAGMTSGDAIVFAGRIPIYYIASVGPYLWRKLTSASFLGVSGGAAISPATIASAAAQYNDAAVGGFASVASTRYYCVFICVTNMTSEPVIALLSQGQSSNTTLATALGEAFAQFQNLLGLSSLNIQEVVPIYRLTFQYSSAAGFNASRIRLVDATFINIRLATTTGTINNPAVTSLPAAQITNDVSGFNGILTAAETTAQAAFDRIDDYAAPKASPIFTGGVTNSSWITGTVYTALQMVLNNNTAWVCLINHTAGTFVTDWLTNGYWAPLGSAAGMVKMWGNATAPAGYLLCNGASLLRTDYALLFSVIGTTFGNVDGTHFNLPDFSGLSPVGVGTSTKLTDKDGATGTALSGVLGTYYKHLLQGHEIDISGVNTGGAGTRLVAAADALNRGSAGVFPYNKGTIVADAANGTPQIGTYTRGPRLGINFIIKT